MPGRAAAWLARGLLAAVACSSVAWGTTTLPDFVDQTRLDGAKDLILRNVPVSDAELDDLGPLLSRAVAEKDCMTRSAVSWLKAPTTVLDGALKSAIALPSRRNSGLKARSKSRPILLPEASSISGPTVPRVVPGSTVERIVTVCGAFLARSPRPISIATCRIAVRSRLPLPDEGVPTQTIDMSLLTIASVASVVAVS